MGKIRKTTRLESKKSRAFVSPCILLNILFWLTLIIGKASASGKHNHKTAQSTHETGDKDRTSKNSDNLHELKTHRHENPGSSSLSHPEFEREIEPGIDYNYPLHPTHPHILKEDASNPSSIHSSLEEDQEIIIIRPERLQKRLIDQASLNSHNIQIRSELMIMIAREEKEVHKEFRQLYIAPRQLWFEKTRSNQLLAMERSYMWMLPARLKAINKYNGYLKIFGFTCLDFPELSKEKRTEFLEVQLWKEQALAKERVLKFDGQLKKVREIRKAMRQPPEDPHPTALNEAGLQFDELQEERKQRLLDRELDMLVLEERGTLFTKQMEMEMEKLKEYGIKSQREFAKALKEAKKQTAEKPAEKEKEEKSVAETAAEKIPPFKASDYKTLYQHRAHHSANIRNIILAQQPISEEHFTKQRVKYLEFLEETFFEYTTRASARYKFLLEHCDAEQIEKLFPQIDVPNWSVYDAMVMLENKQEMDKHIISKESRKKHSKTEEEMKIQDLARSDTIVRRRKHSDDAEPSTSTAQP